MTHTRRDAMAAGASAASALFFSAAGARAEAPKAPAMIAGPDPDVHAPRFKLPRGAVDAHTHIFGPQAAYPYAAERPYTAPEAPLAAFAALHAAIGCDRAVIVNATLHGTDNRVVTDAIAQSGGRYAGVCNLADDVSDATLAALDKGGIRACRFAFLKRLGGVKDLGAFRTLVARVKEIGWHVDVYLEPGSLEAFAPLLKSLPATYVLDHMGSISAAKGLDDADFKALLALQTSDEKCWVKITGLERASAGGRPFLDAVPFAKALVDGAPDRVIWGTDWPHPNVKVMPNDGDIVDLIPLYAPDAATQRKLLVDNPARLFRFPAA